MDIMCTRKYVYTILDINYLREENKNKIDDSLPGFRFLFKISLQFFE